MDISKLLKTISVDIYSLSLGEKLIGGLIVTILAMAIVFIVLLLILISINLMNKLINKKRNDEIFADKKETQLYENNKDEIELIAVIAASIASCLNTSTSNIIVKSVVRVNSNESNWAKFGRIERMNNLR